MQPTEGPRKYVNGTKGIKNDYPISEVVHSLWMLLESTVEIERCMLII